MAKFQLYSSQTGAKFKVIDAPTKELALDNFAQSCGFKDCNDMWTSRPRPMYEYLSAYTIKE